MMLSKPAQCEGCPAQNLGRSFVAAEGPPNPKLILLGQGPGANEAESGRPFYPGYLADATPRTGVKGAAGRRLMHWLEQAGLSRADVWLDNVVRCWLPKNRAPTRREVTHCTSTYVLPALRDISAVVQGRAVVVPVGVPAMAYLYPGKVTEWRAGSLERITLDGLTLHVIGILHPAFVLRGQWGKEPAQVRYLQRAVAVADKLAKGEEVAMMDVNQPPPGIVATLQPTIDVLLSQWSVDKLRGGLVVDCEYPSGRVDMVGFTRMSDLAYVCVDLLATNRGPFWQRDSRLWLAKVLGDPTIPKIFQNGLSADIPALERLGIKVAGYAFDTMLAAHVAYSEMPKQLGFLGTFYHQLPSWKHIMYGGDDPEEEIK